MKKRTYITICFILAITMIAVFSMASLAFAQTDGNATIIASGTFRIDANIKWDIDSNKTLTIRGTGMLATTDDEIERWKQYDVKSVVIKEGITKIANDSFWGCASITKITMPNGITEIGEHAFKGCSSLTEINIPDSVRSISIYAFQDCTSLTEITIPEGVYTYGFTFMGCTGLKKVNMPNYIPYICCAMFDGCSALTEITIPDSVTDIRYDAFRGCSALTEMTIPDSVTKIGPNAFDGCSALTDITIPRNVEEIGDYAFAECDSLENVVILGSRQFNISVFPNYVNIVYENSLNYSNVTLQPNEFTYSGIEHLPELTVKTYLGTQLVKDKDYTVTYEDNIAAGLATVTVKGIGEYKGSCTKTFEILKKYISEETIRLAYSDTKYDGTAKNPEVTIDGLKRDVDYTVTYDDNVSTGTATVTVQGIGNYTGTVTKTFEILRADISGAAVNLAYSNIRYDGMAKLPEVTIEGLKRNIDYTVTYDNNIKAGAATVTVQGIGNYEGSITKTFEILRKDISGETVDFIYFDRKYDGAAKTPIILIDGLKKNVDYVVTYKNNIKAGTAVVTIEGIGSYEGSIVKTFEILKADIPGEIVSLAYLDTKYDGTAKTPEVTIEGLKKDVDYTVTYDNNIKAGTATVTVQGIGNYEGRAIKTFDILRKDISGETINLSYFDIKYDGTVKIPIAVIDGLKKDVDYTVSYKDNIEVGTAIVIVQGIGNYKDSITKTFEILRADISEKTVTLAYSDTKYDGTAKTPEVTINGLKKDVDYTVTYKDNISTGIATVTIEGIGNYTGTVTKTFEISKADISGKTVTLSYSDTKYDGTAKSPEVTIVGLKKGVDYTVTYDNNIKAGAATVTVQGISNYEGIVTKTFEISKADISEKNISLAYSDTKYDGTAKTPEVTIAGLKKDVDCTVVYKNNIKAGTATVTVQGIGNYTGTVTKTFEISKADISEKTVSLAYSDTKYDGTAKTPEVTIAGLKKDVDYTVSYKDNIKAGTATLTIEGIGNYKGTVIKTFTIVAESDSLLGDETKLRIYGPNRYETSIETANALKTSLGIDKFNCIIVADGRGYADALAGAYLAKVKTAPILVVGNDIASQNLVKEYIVNNLNKNGTVYILGGTGVVSENFEKSISGDSRKIKRLGGKDRYATNLLILKEAGVGNEDILVCSGMGFADSLSASAVGKPVLLLGDKLYNEQIAYLKNIGFTNRKFYIIGGTGAVSTSVEKDIAAYGGSVKRISGANRYYTSVAVARQFFGNHSETAVFAYGLNFPDGLSGGPLAMSLEGPLLLITSADTSAAASYIKSSSIKNAVILGGPALISDKAVANIIG